MDRPPRQIERSDIVRMVVFGVIASVAGIALGLAIDWFPPSASNQARSISRLYDVLIIFSVPVFVLVVTIVLFSVHHFRVRAGEEDLDGPPTHGNTRVEVIWTAIPSIIVAGLCVYAASVLSEIDTARADQVKVAVYAQQFAWSYKYTAPSGKQFLSNTMYLPCTPTTAQIGQGSPCNGRQAALDLNAVDVIHSFWVPAMSMKQDVVPGITTHTKLNPDRLGTYAVVCTELCGIGHGIMRSTVKVVPPAIYAAWLKSEGLAKVN